MKDNIIEMIEKLLESAYGGEIDSVTLVINRDQVYHATCKDKTKESHMVDIAFDCDFAMRQLQSILDNKDDKIQLH